MDTIFEKVKTWITDIKVWITAAVALVAETAFDIVDKIQAFF